ncbi:MAG: UDP-3-O-[3-hydroxymyristoyl] glucosamine N-acyltransferase [Cognaticolwellia sp.]|jgi:UDP-3-O-[3-hydroxymyristoyl] glucosamine N-acyltransferase
MPWTAGELSAALGARLEGDPDTVVKDVRGLREAGPEHLSFLANPRYRRFLSGSQAGAVLLREGIPFSGIALRVSDPYASYARAAALFHPQAWGAPGVDSRAAVHPSAQIGEGCCIEPFAVVGPGAVLGERVWLQSHAYVGGGARVGPDSRLMPSSVLMEDCVLGARVWLNPGAVVGSQGFGFAPTPTGMLKIPQVGQAVLEDDVELGANTCVDRAAIGETRIGQGSKLDNLVQVGHGAQLGPHNVLVAYAGIAGTSKTGVGVTLAARSTILGHLKIGDGVTAAAHTMIAQDTASGRRVAGVPAQDHKAWLRASKSAQRSHEMERELRSLRAELQSLRDHLSARALKEKS